MNEKKILNNNKILLLNIKKIYKKINKSLNILNLLKINIFILKNNYNINIPS